MRSTATFVVGVFALASSAVAQKAGWAVVTSPAEGQQVPTGQSFNIEWTPGKAKGPVTISLMGGDDQGSQQTIGDLTTSVDVAAGSYAWMVDCALGTDNIYGLTITSNADKGTFQYSFPFHIKKSEACGGNSDDTSSSSASATSSTYSATPMPTSSSSVLSTTTTSSSSASSMTSASSTTVMTTPTATITSATLPTETLPTATGAPTDTTLSQAPTNTWTTSASSAAPTTTPSSTTPSGSTSASPSASPSSSTIPDNGAAAQGASSLALIGGLVVAALAL